MQRPALVVLCFLPDAGHILPLLRLAHALKSRLASDIVCVLPTGFADRVRQYGFQYHELRCSTEHSLVSAVAPLSRRSIFYNAYSNYIDLSDHYWVPLTDAVSRELGPIVDDLTAMQPWALLCDSYLLADWYVRLAACCGASLALNHAEGTWRWLQPAFVRTYGLVDVTPIAQRTVERLGQVAELWYRGWRALRYASRRQISNRTKIAANARAGALFGPNCAEVRTLHVSGGLAALETSPDGDAPTSRQFVLAPLTDSVVDQLADELAAWLGRQAAGSVIYVSFGTMIQLYEPLFGRLLRGLIDTGAPVIWSLPDAQRPMLSGYRLPENVRVYRSVAQSALLATTKIGCFVTHGGAGSCQEAATFGTPVLCIPFMWDQPYNSSLLVRLGLGRKLSKRRVTRRRLLREIREILSDPGYAAAGQDLAARVRSLQKSQSGELDRLAALLGADAAA
jgi:UDP:flavonoid glycosyltransferase YjiC (YdhE family)